MVRLEKRVVIDETGWAANVVTAGAAYVCCDADGGPEPMTGIFEQKQS